MIVQQSLGLGEFHKSVPIFFYFQINVKPYKVYLEFLVLTEQLNSWVTMVGFTFCYLDSTMQLWSHQSATKFVFWIRHI